MFNLLSTKLIVSFLAASALVATVGRVVDAKFYSAEFFKDQEIKFSKRLDDGQRAIASNDSLKFESVYFPVNEITLWRMAGEWRVFRAVDENNNEVEVANEKVAMNLIGNSKVSLSKDEFAGVKVAKEMSILFISNFEDFGNRQTVVLFVPVANGYRTIEAEKIMKKVTIVDSVAAKLESRRVEASVNNAPSQAQVNGLIVESDVELTLAVMENSARGLKSAKPSASGSISMRDGKIESLEASAELGGETITIEAGVTEILDGGVVQVMVNGAEKAGILTNNGRDGYALRVGELVVQFLTDDAFEAALNRGEFDQVDSKKEFQAELEEKVQAAQVESEERVAQATIDAEKAQADQFEFTQVQEAATQEQAE